MLVLGRKRGESIVIDNIRITLVDSSTGGARIGIEAPPGVVILREELAHLTHPVQTDEPNGKPAVSPTQHSCTGDVLAD